MLTEHLALIHSEFQLFFFFLASQMIDVMFLVLYCEGSAKTEKDEGLSSGKSIDKAEGSSSGKSTDEAGGIINERIMGLLYNQML